MSKDFVVSLLLKAKNQMTPAIQQVEQKIKQMDNAVKSFGKSSGGKDPFDTWAKNAEKAYSKVSNLHKKLEDIMHSGFKDVAFGVGLAAPIDYAIDRAAELQTKLTTLKLSGISDAGLKQLEKSAEELSQKTIFKKSQVVDIELALSKAGLNENKIKSTLQTATYLGELENQRTGADGVTTAKHFAQMAEQLGLTSVNADERKANRITTKAQEDAYIAKKLNNYAESVNRVATVTSADVGTLFESSKYFNLVARLQGVKVEDAMMTQGLAARFGLEGSVGGVHLKDFYSRLNPYEWLGHGKTGISQQLYAMDELGFLKGAEYTTTKQGRRRYTSIKGDVFHDEKGKVKDPTVIFGELAKSFEKYKDKPHGIQEFESAMKAIFGEQGRDIAAAVAMNYEAMHQLQADAKKVKPIHDGITEYQKTFHQKQAAFGASVSNTVSKAGSAMLPDATALLAKITPLVNKAGDWISQNETFVKWLGRGAMAIAGFAVVMGAAKIVAAGFGHLILGPIKSLLSVNKKVATGAKGMWDKFRGKTPTGKPTGKVPEKGTRTNLMTVRATRVYINGPVSQMGGKRGNTGKGKKPTILGADGKPLVQEHEGKKFKKPKSDTPGKPKTFKEKVAGLFKRTPKPPATGLEQMGRLAKLGKLAKGAGIVGTVAGTALAGYDLYQQAKQSGWRQAASQKGGALVGGTVGGFIGGAAGSLLGPMGTVAGAAAGNWLGTKAGEWFDQGGYTKKAVDWAVSMKDKLKNWWNGDEPKKANTDVKQMSSTAQQHTTVVRGQMNQLTATAGQSANQTKGSLGSISTVTGQGKTWGTTLMSGLISSITAQFPGLRTAISEMQSIFNVSIPGPKISSPSFPTSIANVGIHSTTSGSSGIARYADSKNKGKPTLPFGSAPRLNANGNIINKPHWVGPNDIAGEAGPEAIIPLSPSRRSQGLYWMKQAAHHLGVSVVPGRVNYFANGGILRSNRFDSTDEEQPRRLVRRFASGGYQDNREISIVIYAKDGNEAEHGVRRALDVPDKYKASRGARRPVWDEGGAFA